MLGKRIVSGVSGLAPAGLLAGSCIGSRSEDFPASSLTVCAAAAAEAARVVRVIDADTYIMLSGSTTYRLRLLGVDAPEHDQAFGLQAPASVARLQAPAPEGPQVARAWAVRSQVLGLLKASQLLEAHFRWG